MPCHASRHRPDLLRPSAEPKPRSAWAGTPRDCGDESFNGCSSPTTSSRMQWGSWGQVEGGLRKGSCSIFPGQMLCVFCPEKPAHLRCIRHHLPIPAFPHLQHHRQDFLQGPMTLPRSFSSHPTETSALSPLAPSRCSHLRGGECLLDTTQALQKCVPAG